MRCDGTGFFHPLLCHAAQPKGMVINMSDREIIEAALNFLVVDYGFSYEYHSLNGKEEYFQYKNNHGCLTYYQWAQFGEQEFSATYNQTFRKIQLFEEYPKYFASFKSKHKGIKWLFQDSRKDYWEMISNIIKDEIASTGALFGIQIRK